MNEDVTTLTSTRTEYGCIRCGLPYSLSKCKAMAAIITYTTENKKASQKYKENEVPKKSCVAWNEWKLFWESSSSDIIFVVTC